MHKTTFCINQIHIVSVFELNFLVNCHHKKARPLHIITWSNGLILVAFESASCAFSGLVSRFVAVEFAFLRRSRCC